MTLRSADFESAASASSAIPALHCNLRKLGACGLWTTVLRRLCAISGDGVCNLLAKQN